MLFIAALISIEILILLILKELFYRSSRFRFYISLVVNVIFSAGIWYLFIKIKMFKGPYDLPEYVSDQMNFNGILCGVVVPRLILVLFHYTGKLLRIGKKDYIRWMTRTGIIISCMLFTIIALGSLRGRFNFKTEEITVYISNLPSQLNGLKIVHMSDMHLAGFYRHQALLGNLMDKVNSFKPDLIINTGDFISFGWREFSSCDTILAKAKSRYGNFAVLGNHDMGTYYPNATRKDNEINIKKMKELIKSSGYHLLEDSNHTIEIRGIKVEFIGVSTSGRFPGIIYGDLKKAMENPDSAEFSILLCHDPNQWDEEVAGKRDINFTFAGHTHAMQMGILTKKFRWSPAKYFYPHWNGLYSENDQFLYVNRGLGVLAIPFRIWMPPEITILTFKNEQIIKNLSKRNG